MCIYHPQPFYVPVSHQERATSECQLPHTVPPTFPLVLQIWVTILTFLNSVYRFLPPAGEQQDLSLLRAGPLQLTKQEGKETIGTETVTADAEKPTGTCLSALRTEATVQKEKEMGVSEGRKSSFCTVFSHRSYF